MSQGIPRLGTCYPISETFLEPGGIGLLDGPTRIEIQVTDELRVGERNSDILVSISLFSGEDRKWSGSWDFGNFKKALANPSIDKYWNPLHRKRAEYPGAWLRVYLDPNLREMAKPLMEVCGINEVCVMAGRSDGFKHGMLWRYLPMLEEDDGFCVHGVGLSGLLMLQVMLRASRS